MIEIVASMSLPEYREVCRSIRPRRRRRISKTGRRALEFVGFGLYVAFVAGMPMSAGAKLELYLLPLFLLAAFTIYLHRAITLSYRRQQVMLQNQTMRLDETGIAGEWKDGTMTYRYTWTAFEHCIELASGFIFLLPAAGFVRVPKAPLSGDEQAQVRGWSGDISHELR